MGYMKQLMLEEQDNFWDTCYTVMLEAEHLEEYFSKMNMMFANKVLELPFGISREDFEEQSRQNWNDYWSQYQYN